MGLSAISAIGNGKLSTARRGRVENRQMRDKQLAQLMEWVTEQINQAAHVPHLSDVTEQAFKGFGFVMLSFWRYFRSSQIASLLSL